ncbi:hypothetical protein ACFO0N_09080 [Halobium salinum]|uniref:Restriction endonuclease n=1 Tax=Halobium salinum TaxID=1364940 RepID=A0ABD5PC98_9EURY|nr:hypothetical protein [Halobium salinum]
MGEAARRVQERLRGRLADAHPEFDWTVEHRVAGTPVDVAGDGPSSDGETLVLVELEWRRADPADNTAKLFRHLAAGTLDAYDRVVVRQAFTHYYALASGGVSSKRQNAEFVGDRVARTYEHVGYEAVTLPFDPPKRGGEMPAGWGEAVDAVARELL